MPSSVNAPGVITLTEPPAPVPAVVLTICPPLVTVICGAVTVTDPALPLAVDIAEAMIPLPGAVKLSGPSAVTCTVPPLPGPAVELAICAPPWTVRLSAPTVTEPPGPECRPVAEAAIWLGAIPMPSSARAPGVITVTEPPAPVPAVVLAICPPLVTVTWGAPTVTEPALPLAVDVARAMMPVSGSLKLRGPCPVTCTAPPLPDPAVLDVTWAPPDTAIAPPAINTTSPAGPLDPGPAEAVIPLAPF